MGRCAPIIGCTPAAATSPTKPMETWGRVTSTLERIDQRVQWWIILVNDAIASRRTLSTCIWSVCIRRFGRERIWVELSNRPNSSRRFHVELCSIQSERVEILLVELLCLLWNGYQLRSMIKLFVDHLATKLSISFCEQLMFVPNLVDDLRRSDVPGAYYAKKYKFLVFGDGPQGELRRPAQLAGKFACKRF